VLLNLATLYNENGGGGANINTGTSAEFMLFQTNWTNVAENRNSGTGGPYAGNGVDSPYSHGVYIDPNHGYRLKFFVADRDNHRVLIFNSLPTSNAATADVVVGQTGFTTGFTAAANAGGAISAQGFDQPQHVSVAANGTMFVTDLMNHRVLIYNSVPQTKNGGGRKLCCWSGRLHNGCIWNHSFGTQQPRRCIDDSGAALHRRPSQ
jgi:hypothetical protein